MSYDRVTPNYYRTFQPDTPFHPGAEGWTKAPWVTWGDNPNLAGKKRLATDGLGRIVAISGLGAEPDPAAAATDVVMLGYSAAIGVGVGYLFAPKNERRNYMLAGALGFPAARLLWKKLRG